MNSYCMHEGLFREQHFDAKAITRKTYEESIDELLNGLQYSMSLVFIF